MGPNAVATGYICNANCVHIQVPLDCGTDPGVYQREDISAEEVLVSQTL